MERTLVILKPSAIQRELVGEVINRFERKGLRLCGIKMMQLDDAILSEHYAHLREKPFFQRVKNAMMTTPVIVTCWEGLNDAAVVRKKFPAGEEDEKNDGDEGREWASAEIPDVHFSDIAGLDDVKKAITVRMINPVKYPEKYRLYNKKTGGGVLLYGPPGTGKTMIARAIACEVGAKFYAVKGSDIVSKWVGESERNINSLFETARGDELAIIFLDEMDSLLAKRGTDTHNDKRVNEFLQQIDGFSGRSPNLLLLGATNRPWDIDEAALRPGRFSQKIYVPLPDAPARRFMFEKSLKGAPVASDVDVSELTSLTEGYSGADIEDVCDRAKEEPLLKSISSDSVVPVARQDFLNALRAVPPSVTESEAERFARYAETGE